MPQAARNSLNGAFPSRKSDAKLEKTLFEGVMPELTSAEQERIFEEEKIRTKARLKASLTPRNIAIYLVLIAIVISFAAIMGKINSSGNNGHLAGLDNEIRSNVILLSSVEGEDKQLLLDKGAIQIFIPNYFNEDILAESIAWHPENFAAINLRDRFNLFVDGVKIMKENGKVKQFSDPASKAPRKFWKESINGE